MQKHFAALRGDLMSRFPERQHVIDGSLAAVLAEEHVLLLGPPGTAKSALVRALAQAFGGTYFERLLTKFSTPEELFGPVSLKGLEVDRFTRVTTGMLPEVEFAFVDEVFKANSAILNALLSVVNERLFHNDGQPVQVPLVTMFGASNELPEGKELEALFDRFALRFQVDYLLRPQHLRDVLTAPEPKLGDPFIGRFNWSRNNHMAFIIGVLAHEIGHLLSAERGHAGEHRADGVASYVLSRLGLSHEPFTLWLFSTRGGSTHPDGFDRMRIAQDVWAQAAFFPNS